MAYKLKYTLVALVGMAVAAGGAWWLQSKPPVAGASPAAGALAQPSGGPTGGPGRGGGPGRAPAVEVAKVQSLTLFDEAQAVGSLRSRQSVMLRPEVGGRVKQIFFNDGQRVSQGQLMVQFEDQLQQAQLAQVRAELSIAQANHKRNQELVAQNFISQRSLDESAAALEVSRAKLALSEASLQRLKVLAPFDGIAGLKQIHVGDYLKDGTDMVNLEDIDAVLLDFRLPERYQAKIRAGQKAELTLDALPGSRFTAIVQAVDPLIDPNGRSVGVRGCIDNRQQQLRPGMFARVNAVFDVRENALVIPEEAIVPQGQRSFVFKVVAGEAPGSLKSERVAVKLGLRQPGQVEILQGLSPGDTVVTAGHQRLQAGGTEVRVIDLSPAGAGAGTDPAQGTSAGAAAGSPGGAQVGASGPAKPQVRVARQAAVAGPNPCLRGANAAR